MEDYTNEELNRNREASTKAMERLCAVGWFEAFGTKGSVGFGSPTERGRVAFKHLGELLTELGPIDSPLELYQLCSQARQFFAQKNAH